MNLLELITKNDPNVQIQTWATATRTWVPHEAPNTLFSKTVQQHLKLDGRRPKLTKDVIRGLVLRSGVRIVIKQAAKYWPNYAAGLGVFKIRSIGATEPLLTIGWGTGNLEVLAGKAEYVAKEKQSEISVPEAVPDNPDLVVEVPLQKGAKLFLGVHRVLDRSELFERCKGEGVEVGPGPKPQILPSAQTRVKYVEQATPDQWQQLYGKDTKTPIDPTLWQHYVVGNADNIPALPDTLDFIFSSHVIEHLANPLGHLAYWATLLKANGVVAAVIPDKSGCKDYLFEPSSIDELVKEYRQGIMQPTLAHYQRWARYRAPKADPAEILHSGRSIHVHFYTPDSMEAVLNKMFREIGYRRCTVTREHNHKDFFVLLEK
jgi:SAM-dependent methyltransferase